MDLLLRTITLTSSIFEEGKEAAQHFFSCESLIMEPRHISKIFIYAK